MTGDDKWVGRRDDDNTDDDDDEERWARRKRWDSFIGLTITRRREKKKKEKHHIVACVLYISYTQYARSLRSTKWTYKVAGSDAIVSGCRGEVNDGTTECQMKLNKYFFGEWARGISQEI